MQNSIKILVISGVNIYLNNGFSCIYKQHLKYKLTLYKNYFIMKTNIQKKTFLLNKQNQCVIVIRPSKFPNFKLQNINLDQFENSLPEKAQIQKTQHFSHFNYVVKELNLAQSAVSDASKIFQPETFETVDESSSLEDDLKEQQLAATASSEFPKINKQLYAMEESDEENSQDFQTNDCLKFHNEHFSNSIILKKTTLQNKRSKFRNFSLKQDQKDQQEDVDKLRHSNIILKQKLNYMMELLQKRTEQLQKKDLKIKELQQGLIELKQEKDNLQAQNNGLLNLII